MESHRSRAVESHRRISPRQKSEAFDASSPRTQKPPDHEYKYALHSLERALLFAVLEQQMIARKQRADMRGRFRRHQMSMLLQSAVCRPGPESWSQASASREAQRRCSRCTVSGTAPRSISTCSKTLTTRRKADVKPYYQNFSMSKLSQGIVCLSSIMLAYPRIQLVATINPYPSPGYLGNCPSSLSAV